MNKKSILDQRLDRLMSLIRRHGSLHDGVALMQKHKGHDEEELRRLKKRKLQVKDQIAALVRLLKDEHDFKVAEIPVDI